MVSAGVATESRYEVHIQTQPVPWYAWLSLATTAAAVGGEHWDISWHMSIGRDALWTPPHLMIQAAALLSAIVFLWFIIRSTSSHDPAVVGNSVRIFGLRAPIGAFIAAWGAATMAASVPFDNWWHNAYGLDVRIISPPHLVLGIGIFGMEIGGIVLICSAMNRALDAGDERFCRKLSLIVIGIGSLFVFQTNTGTLEFVNHAIMHSGIYYLAASVSVLIALVPMAVIARTRWATTAIASLYTAISLAFFWGLPLIPAEPKLGPVYTHVTHLVPLSFPLLIIVPAAVMDGCLWRSIERWSRWAKAAIIGPVFLLLLFAVQWPFGTFLNSPAASGWPFQSDRALHAYFVRPEWLQLTPGQEPFSLWTGLFLAFMASIITARLGLALGYVGRRVRR
jgi:hypothetical protein